jgi:hypothetical protein
MRATPAVIESRIIGAISILSMAMKMRPAGRATSTPLSGMAPNTTPSATPRAICTWSARREESERATSPAISAT